MGSHVKVLLFANTDWYLYNFQLALARELRDRGNEVILVSPEGSYSARLQAQGFHWVNFQFSRRGVNPLVEAWTVIRLIRLYHREKPDLIHHFTVKCVVYGSLAASCLGIRTVVNSVTGLGYVFTEGQGARTWLKGLVNLFYRMLLRRTQVIFQNPEDRDLFQQQNLVAPGRVSLILGSGTDTKQFVPRSEAKGDPVIILPARLLWDKGVGEFVAAARILRDQGIVARFALVGDTDEGNPAAVPSAQLKQWAESGVIEWWGWQEDMAQVYPVSHIVCLPTAYREGVPKTLVEAAACGRSLVATNIPGCREVVRDGENGYLVRPRDINALVVALRKLIESPSLRATMGIRGREIVLQKFSTTIILSQTLDVYRAVLGDKKLS
jgi:glycosyltransferase involved in cell wall biosynthesis